MSLGRISELQHAVLAGAPDAQNPSAHCGEEYLRSIAAGRSVRVFLLGAMLLLPLAVVPGVAQPFSRPKLTLLTMVVLLGLAVCRHRLKAAWSDLPLVLRIALAAWIAAVSAAANWDKFVSPASLILPLVGVGWLMVLMAAKQRPQELAWALAVSGGALAALAVAQYVGADPFSLLGWVPSSYRSERMRVFATLGNPNYVAAFLSGLLPLTFSLVGSFRRRPLPASLFLLQAAALFTTGSRAPVLGLAAAGLWLAALRLRKAATIFVLAALGITLLASLFSPARDLRTTLRGRVYVWKVVAPHLREHFLLGLGPGGFGAAFPLWETQYWQASLASERDQVFAGIEDHAHNDYLEILADYGAFGLLAFLTAVFAFLRTAWIRTRAAPDSPVAGASAAVVALLAVALVDFPLMRPAEVFLLWSLVAVSLLKEQEKSESLGDQAMNQKEKQT